MWLLNGGEIRNGFSSLRPWLEIYSVQRLENPFLIEPTSAILFPIDLLYEKNSSNWCHLIWRKICGAGRNDTPKIHFCPLWRNFAGRNDTPKSHFCPLHVNFTKIFIHFCPLKLIWRKKHEFHAQHSYSIAIGNTSLTCITFSLHAKKKNRENIHVHNCTTVQTLTEKMIRQINYLVISFVKCYFHEIVCQIWVRLRVNFRN